MPSPVQPTGNPYLPTPSMPSQSSGTPSLAGGPFKSSPQRFQKSKAQAARLAQALLALQQRGPQTHLATVVDTRYQLSYGYVLCQMETSVVQVINVPYGTVVPGMRLYCRPLGAYGAAISRQYVFDGYAPALASLGTQSGSLLIAQQEVSYSAPAFAYSDNGQGTQGNVGAYPTLTSSVGYYWHLFFYLPVLPNGVVTLLQMTPYHPASGQNYPFQIDVLPTGQLRAWSTNGAGYLTTNPVPPHQMHWVVVQPGLSGRELLVDGQASYSGVNSAGLGGSGISPSPPLFAGGTTTYTLTLLSGLNFAFPCPLGSWVSKVGYGICSGLSGSGLVGLPTSIPAQDSDLPSTIGGGLGPIALYLCEDRPSLLTMSNALGQGSGESFASGLTCNGSATLVATGPY